MIITKSSRQITQEDSVKTSLAVGAEAVDIIFPSIGAREESPEKSELDRRGAVGVDE